MTPPHACLIPLKLVVEHFNKDKDLFFIKKFIIFILCDKKKGKHDKGLHFDNGIPIQIT